jgi:hypothetical protein
MTAAGVAVPVDVGCGLGLGSVVGEGPDERVPVGATTTVDVGSGEAALAGGKISEADPVGSEGEA